MLLHCFPHAGGTGTVYREWGTALSPLEIRPVSYATVGLDHLPLREAAVRMADRFASPEPFALFGHSMGALLAFEVVRCLAERGGAGPVALIVSGHVAPHLPSPGPILHALPAPRFWAEVFRMGGTPPELQDDPELRRAVEPRLRHELRAAETYRYRPGQPLHCPVLALAGADDTRAPAEQMQPWQLHTHGAFTLRTLPGGHFFLTERASCVHEALRSVLMPELAG